MGVLVGEPMRLGKAGCARAGKCGSLGCEEIPASIPGGRRPGIGPMVYLFCWNDLFGSCGAGLLGLEAGGRPDAPGSGRAPSPCGDGCDRR